MMFDDDEDIEDYEEPEVVDAPAQEDKDEAQAFPSLPGKRTAAEQMRQKRREKDEQEQVIKMKQRRVEEDKQRQTEEQSRRRWERNFSSEDGIKDETNLDVYYCAHCGHFAMILDVDLALLPKRKTDSASVLDEQKRTFKRTMKESGRTLLKRPKGVEAQYRYECTQCSLLLAYRPVPYRTKTKFSYIVEGALTNDPTNIGKRPIQGHVEQTDEPEEDKELMEAFAKAKEEDGTEQPSDSKEAPGTSKTD